MSTHAENSRRRHQRRLARGWAACVLAVFVAACGDPATTASGGAGGANGDEPSLGSVAAESAALRPAGTELADGVVVQEGTELVGTVFPLVEPSAQTDESSNGDERPPDGWQAVLRVTDAPVEVWEAYADALSIGDVASARAACVVTRLDPPGDRGDDGATSTIEVTSESEVSSVPPQRFLTERAIEGENRLQCSAQVEGITMSMVVGATPRCADAAEPTSCDLLPSSHLLIRRSPTSVSSDYTSLGADELRYQRTPQQEGVAPEPIPVPTGPITELRLTPVTTASTLPGPGERYDDSLDDYLTEAADAPVSQVPDGGRSLIAPSMLIPCNSGLVAVLATPGSPEQVLDWFDGTSGGDAPPTRIGGTDASGNRYSFSQLSSAGGFYLDITAVAQGDESMVLVTECGD